MLNNTSNPIRLADLDEKDREIASLKAKIESLEIKIANLEIQLQDFNKIFHYEKQFPIYFGLTETEAQIIHILYKVDQISKESIWLNLYHDRIDTRPEPKIVDVFMCKIRKKLKPYKIDFITMWGYGYRLDQQNKIRLKAYLDEAENN